MWKDIIYPHFGGRSVTAGVGTNAFSLAARAKIQLMKGLLKVLLKPKLWKMLDELNTALLTVLLGHLRIIPHTSRHERTQLMS